ncbi:MAG: BadF/BadG/BcrA/BcrD ATPase family protein, partial [Planctomycetota bacterium]
ALAVIAGTGSIAVGRKNDGSRVRCGGWGPMFSDEGSGYDIAKECLRVASFHEDGRADFARIHDAALEHFGATEFTEIVAKIHNATREEISRFTRKVTHGEMLQDRKVQRILDAAAHQLATMTENVARRVACDDKPIPLALAGGVLCNIPLVRRSLLANLSKRAISVKPIDVNDPVQGSVLLAADACIRRSRLAENGVLSWPFPKGWR